MRTILHRFHPDLRLSEAQVVSLRVLHLPSALRDCIQAIMTAAGHVSVTSALSRLSLYLLIDRMALPHSATYSCRETLRSLNWQAAFARCGTQKRKTSYWAVFQINILPHVYLNAVYSNAIHFCCGAQILTWTILSQRRYCSFALTGSCIIFAKRHFLFFTSAFGELQTDAKDSIDKTLSPVDQTHTATFMPD